MSAAILLLPVFLALLDAQDKVNADSQVLADFDKRIADYVKIHRIAAAQTPGVKTTNSSEALQRHEHKLAEQIAKTRPFGKQGDIFTLPVTAEFRRLLNITMNGADGAPVRQSLKHAEPVRAQVLRVNESYPAGVPLQTTPPSLLMNLPPLPPVLEYRIVGQTLVLRDVEANVIVDFIPKIIP